MKLRTILMLLFTAFIMSCAKNSGHISRKYLIPQEKFTNILVEMHMIDAITNAPEYYRKFSATDSVNVHAGIFKKYDVSKAMFDSTMVYYTRNPEQYQKIYDDVILKLNLKLDQLRNNDPSFRKENDKENSNAPFLK